ncbi:SOS response-associated peptidase [Metabacillus iocasae]|nr:SOS response-associated peptidase [Metabacillus iocasae]
MCGRFYLHTPLEELKSVFHFDYSHELEPRYNIAPTQSVLAIVQENERRIGHLFDWGLVPSWAKDTSFRHKMINARAETLTEKPSFKSSFRSKRCIILADGFFEWKKEGKTKVPYRIQLKTSQPFAFAGLWEKWEKGEEPLYTCTIVTTEPNELVGKLHHRMAVILKDEHIDAWLDPTITDTDYLQSLLKSYPADEMEYSQVSSLVNSPKNDVKQCIEPI